MNPQNDQDWERRLQELEIEIDPPSSPSTVNQTDEAPEIAPGLAAIGNWFRKLPKLGQIIVVLVTIVVAFSLLNAVLRLVTALLSLVILGIVLSVLYKWIMAPRT